jgi:hypothetical protein
VWFFRRDPHVKPEGPLAFRVRVRTRSGEVVEIRLSKNMEISPTETGYFVRKEIVAPRSLDRAVKPNQKHRPVRKEVQGGELVPIREWA